jgi:hypothetical protein
MVKVKDKESAMVPVGFTGSISTLATMMKPSTGGLFQHVLTGSRGRARSVRNDCGAGCWKDGENRLKIKGKSLRTALIQVRPAYGKLGISSTTNWLEIFFVPLESMETTGEIPSDFKNRLCSTYVKTRSADAVFALFENIGESNQDPSNFVYDWTFEKYSSEVTTYYGLTIEACIPTESEWIILNDIKRFHENGGTLDTGMTSEIFEVYNWNLTIDEVIELKERIDNNIEFRKKA